MSNEKLRTIVTGGSGFIGTNLCESLLNAGTPVANLDIVPPRNPEHTGIWKNIDVRDRGALIAEVREFAPQVIFHMAARTDLDGSSLSDYDANTVGARNMVDAALAAGTVRRAVFASSRLVCRIGHSPVSDTDYCPSTAYGESKVVGEQVVREAAAAAPWTWIIVRPTSIWGPWFGIPYRLFFDAVLRGHYVHPRDLIVMKSFGYVENTVNQLVAIRDAPPVTIDRRTIYLADYPPINVGEMAAVISAEAGRGNIRQVPQALLQLGARIGDLAKAVGWREPPLTTFRLTNLVTPMEYDLRPLEAIAGRLKYEMPEGVRRTVLWMRTRGDLR